MLFKTHELSAHAGELVFVPNFKQLDVKRRNKMNKYIGRGQEAVPKNNWLMTFAVLSPPALTFTGIGIDNTVMGIIGLIGMLLLVFGGMGYMIFDGFHQPSVPTDVPLVPMSDVRWSMLLVAFGDNKELWEWMCDKAKASRYHHWPQRDPDLSARVNEVLSAYMTSGYPTVETAQVVRAAVERIFDAENQKQLEQQIAREAQQAIEAAGAKQLFDINVQMAQRDTEHHAIMASNDWR